MSSDRSTNVIVVTHNSAAILTECIASLPDAFVDAGSYRLAVVDNASTDATVELARQLAPEASVLELGRNAGYAAAINAASSKLPPADHTLVLNPDIRLHAGSASALIEAVRRPGVGIAVPRMVDEHGALQHSLRREPTVLRAFTEAVLGGRRASRLHTLGEVVGRDDQYEFEQAASWATGAAMLINRACSEAVGPWDESFFLYSEETDFCLRARDAGFLTWYTPVACVTHLGGESNTSPQLWSLLTANRVRLYAKRHGRGRTAAFRAAVTFNEATRAAIGRETSRASLRELFDADTSTRDKPSNEPGWVCFSSVDWWYHNRAHSDVQLMLRLAQSRKVLFVNSIGMRMPMPGRSTQPVRRIIRKAKSVLRFARRPLPDLPNFTVFTPLILPFYGSSLLRHVNSVLVAMQTRLVARSLGIDIRRAVTFVTVPTAWDVVRRLRLSRVIFNRSDLHSAFEETDQDLIRTLERELLEQADAVLYVSHALQDSERDMTGDRAVFLDHGVDVEHFDPTRASEPSDMESIAHPRVGFFGGIDDYVVDLALLRRVAEELPHVSLVLVGDATCPIDDLVALPNVHWLGFKPYEQIPAYGRSFDVALMPWLRNEWIEHANPIKLKEYLALGLPIVSTDFPEVHHYADVVAIASDPDEFVSLIRAALDGDVVGTAASRRARVAGATWDDRARELLGLGEDGG